MRDDIAHLLGSDLFLACLLPLSLFFLSLSFIDNPFRGLGSFKAILGLSPPPPGHFSLQRAILSYGEYVKQSERELASARAAYGRLGRAHKRIAYDLGYTKKLERLREAIHTNASVTAGIVELARLEFPEDLGADSLSSSVSADLSRVREALKHFMKDWSHEGSAERAVIHNPILDVLRETTFARRQDMHVLVPGSGLGRLAWEISELGYRTTANELSFFMNLAFRFLLSPTSTQVPNQHVLRPFAHWFSHQRTNDALFRTVAFPDIVPRLSDRLHVAECDFFSLRAPEGSAGYNCIVTLFFIDTSLNVIQTLEHIHRLLRPGGMWINLGPLLWTGGGAAAVELSLEEVLHLAETVGFAVESPDSAHHSRRRRTIPCEYTADRQAMMRWVYEAEFWVAERTS